jgi:farnesyl-diphosphate farnesyltransferase
LINRSFYPQIQAIHACAIDAHGALPDNAGMSPHPMHRSAHSPPGAWDLVKDVARSFALSLKLLPAQVRWPVALAYLLARASDSVADAVQTGNHARGHNDARLSALDELQQGLHRAVLGHSPTPLPHVQALLPHIPLAERKLLATMPTWLEALGGLPPADQQLIGVVCDHIIQGQRLDLQRFEIPEAGLHAVHALDTDAELEDYTFQVAGCVGAFWSHICEAHLSGWRNAELAPMVSASVAYGQALQRLNILRDTAQDLALGRCYWPLSDLSTLGLSPAQLALAVQTQDLGTLERVRPLIAAQSQRIRMGLSLGLAYSAAIGPWRLRVASALPALIGLRTLKDIEAAGPQAWLHPVKVPRRFVRHVLWRALWAGMSPSGLKHLGQQLGASVAHLNLDALDGTMSA